MRPDCLSEEALLRFFQITELGYEKILNAYFLYGDEKFAWLLNENIGLWCFLS